MTDHDEYKVLTQELVKVREGHRRFKQAILDALGDKNLPWSITVRSEKSICDEIASLREDALTPEEAQSLLDARNWAIYNPTDNLNAWRTITRIASRLTAGTGEER